MSNNPLKQYFRRPAIYIKLPSQGKYYDRSIVEATENGEFPVFPMTAIDEITARTPDALFSGQAVVDIIQSCIPNIKNAWKINVIDLDTILIAIKVASNGEEMDVNSVCPACNEEGKYGINLVSLLKDQHSINYDETLKVGELEVKFKPLTYFESNKNNLIQYELQKMIAMLENYEDTEEKRKETKQLVEKLNKTMVEIIASTIESIKTPETVVTNSDFIYEFLVHCDKQTNNLIRDYSISLKNKNQLEPLKIKCVHCQHEYSQQLVLNITDFFE